MDDEGLIAMLARMMVKRRGTRSRSPSGYSVFTGAGASVTSGYPLASAVRDRYLNLLYGKQPIRVMEDTFRSEMKSEPTFEAVSAYVTKRFEPSAAKDWIEPLFPRPKASEGYKLLAHLVRDAYVSETIFTTNWDHTLDVAMPDARPVIREAHLRHDSRLSSRIVKLHGCWCDPSSMVWQQMDLPSWLAEELRVTIRARALLFIGYTAADQDVIAAILPALQADMDREAWVINPIDGAPPTSIRELLGGFGRPNNLVRRGFDEFMRLLHSHVYVEAAPAIQRDREVWPLVRWKGTAYRVVSRHYLPLSTGSAQYAGRWHSKGERVLYAALTPDEAVAEVLRDHRAPAPRGLDIVTLRIDVKAAIDLRSGANLGAIGLDQADVIDSDPNLTRGLAGRARDAGAEAAILPSRRDLSSGMVAVFWDSLRQVWPGVSEVSRAPLDDLGRSPP